MAQPPYLRTVDCLGVIEQRLPALSGSARRIAETIVADPWAVLGMTIQDVASAAGVSQPSVTRFCRLIGYAGFREVSQGIAQSLGRIDANEPQPSSAGAGQAASLPELATAIATHQAEAIQSALRSLDIDAVERAAEAISSAHRVSVVGHGGAYVTAMGVAFKLSWAGAYSAAATPDVFSSQAIAIGPHDVVIGVSHQGRTRDTIEVLRLARSYGATTIGLSTVAHAPLSTVSAVSLAVLTPALARSGTFLVANNSLLFLADVLSIAVAKRMWNGTPPHRDDVIEWIEKSMRVGPIAGTERKRRRSHDATGDGSRGSDDGASING